MLQDSQLYTEACKAGNTFCLNEALLLSIPFGNGIGSRFIPDRKKLNWLGLGFPSKEAVNQLAPKTFREFFVSGKTEQNFTAVLRNIVCFKQIIPQT